MLRAGGNAVDAAVAAVLMSFAAESPLTGPGRGRVHARPHGGRREPPARLLRRGARARARPTRSRRRSCRSTSRSRRLDPALPRRAVVVRRLRDDARPRRGARALRHARGSATSPAAPRGAAREGVEVSPIQEYLFGILGPIFRSTPEAAAIYEPDGPAAARRRAARAARARRPARPARRRGPGLPLRRRRRGRRSATGCWSAAA